MMDTNTLARIKAECRALAGNDIIRHHDMTPAWGEAAAVLAEHLVTRPAEELDHITWGELAEVAQAAVPGLGKPDLFQAIFIMSGGWAYLTKWRHAYRLEDGEEVEVDFAAVRRYQAGEPLHPVTGEPDPLFGERTFAYFAATDKLLDLRAFDASAPVATRCGYPARVLTSCRDGQDGHVIVALYDDGSGEGVITTRLNGRQGDGESPLDLVNVPAPLAVPPRKAPALSIDLSQRVCCRDGRRARLLCDDRRDPGLPIVALWSHHLGEEEHVLCCGADGQTGELPDGMEDWPPEGSPLDLMAWSTDASWRPAAGTEAAWKR